MKNLNNILSKIEKIELAEVNVELASTFNQAVDRYKFLEKTIAEYTSKYNDMKRWVQGSKSGVDENLKDLTRIQTSLKELGFDTDANELTKYINSDTFKDFTTLYNAIK